MALNPILTRGQTDSERATSGHRFVAPGYVVGFILVTSLFFLWALANNFNDILIRQFQKALALNRAEAGFIQFVFYLAYFLVALPAGLMMRRLGYRVGILVGLALYAAGALCFYPAAELRAYSAFLVALFVLAAGAATLETAANPYIVAFGDPARAPQRLNLAQAFNGFGAVLAPILGGLFIFSGIEHDTGTLQAMTPAALEAYRATEARTVQLPYLALATVVILVALAIARVKLPDPRQDDAATTTPPSSGPLRSPVLLGAIVAQFFYVGAQVGIWSFFVDFVKEQSPDTPERTAAYLLSGSLAMFMIGRFLGAALMTRVAPARLLAGFGVAAALLVIVAMVTSGVIAIAALALTSFFMSIMFPTIFALGIRDLGHDAAVGSSFIIMAIVGGAILPPLMGWFSHGAGLQTAMALPLLCFVVVALFGFAIGRERHAATVATPLVAS
ncbi:FHS family L-fucose permease-like MFS transporter [Sphingomonas zeicaulis]|uniref:L-fucose:H+ symporter permease n=1 Tax=Sphingomonas zeicaulis TaxID=1632740 RepID=UPI003D1CC77B